MKYLCLVYLDKDNWSAIPDRECFNSGKSLTDAGKLLSAEPLHPAETYVNVGFWSTVPVGVTEGETNRRIEREVRELDGHKSLYSDAFYSRDEFDALYGGAEYRAAKTRYDPDGRLLDLYQKAVQRR